MKILLLLGLSVLCSTVVAQPLPVASPGRYLSVEAEFCADGFADARTSMASSPLVTIPFNPLAVGAELWAQAAWHDSRTNALLLSKASRTAIVDLPRTYRRRALLGTPSGTLGPDTDPSINPILLWR